MSSISPWLGAGRAGLTGWILLGATAAQAVNDLPGGPAVRQMSYAKPATQIAAQMDWLHSVMMVICVLINIVTELLAGRFGMFINDKFFEKGAKESRLG